MWKIDAKFALRNISENSRRGIDGSKLVPGCKIEILGQISLLAQPDLTYRLNLASTGDLDAMLRADFFVKQQLVKILADYGFIYD